MCAATSCIMSTLFTILLRYSAASFVCSEDGIGGKRGGMGIQGGIAQLSRWVWQILEGSFFVHMLCEAGMITLGLLM